MSKTVRRLDTTHSKGVEVSINGRFKVQPFDIKGKMNFLLAKDEKSADKPQVLIKKFYKKRVGTSYTLQELQQREIRIALELSHENIVKTIQVIDDSSRPNVYMVMEYMENGQIMTYDSRKNCYISKTYGNCIPPDRVRVIMRDILSGLLYMHEKGIVHRDIKPANILLDSKGVAKLVDFGISEFVEVDKLGKGSVNATFNGGQIGTLWFLPLEAFVAEKFDGFAGDVYSLGITLYILLCGTPPLALTNQLKFLEVLKQKKAFNLSKFKRGSILGFGLIQIRKTSDFLQVLEQMLDIHKPEKRPSTFELTKHQLFLND